MAIIRQYRAESPPRPRIEQSLKEDKQHRIKAILACHNETATGVTSDIGGLRQVMDSAAHPALLAVDGVSSIGCIDFRMDELGVDLAVCGSRKGVKTGCRLTESPAWSVRFS